jgi:hypothetical protein
VFNLQLAPLSAQFHIKQVSGAIRQGPAAPSFGAVALI